MPIFIPIGALRPHGAGLTRPSSLIRHLIQDVEVGTSPGITTETQHVPVGAGVRRVLGWRE
jgi:hypothetical protein